MTMPKTVRLDKIIIISVDLISVHREFMFKGQQQRNLLCIFRYICIPKHYKRTVILDMIK